MLFKQLPECCQFFFHSGQFSFQVGGGFFLIISLIFIMVFVVLIFSGYLRFPSSLTGKKGRREIAC